MLRVICSKDAAGAVTYFKRALSEEEYFVSDSNVEGFITKVKAAKRNKAAANNPKSQKHRK